MFSSACKTSLLSVDRLTISSTDRFANAQRFKTEKETNTSPPASAANSQSIACRSRYLQLPLALVRKARSGMDEVHVIN